MDKKDVEHLFDHQKEKTDLEKEESAVEFHQSEISSSPGAAAKTGAVHLQDHQHLEQHQHGGENIYNTENRLGELVDNKLSGDVDIESMIRQTGGMHSPIPMMSMGPARQTRNSRSPTTTTTTTQTKLASHIGKIRLNQATKDVLTASPPAPSVAGVETVHTTHTTFIRKGQLAKERKKVSVATKFSINNRPVKLKKKIE